MEHATISNAFIRYSLVITLVLLAVGGSLQSALASLPVVIMQGDSINCTKLTATTCAISDPSDGVTYDWYGDGLISGKNAPCAEWVAPGMKYVYVMNVATGEQTEATV